MINKLIALSIVCGLVVGFAAQANAHEGFQDVLKEQYMLKSFSCKACHPDGDDRKIRTPFADRIAKELKGKGLTKKFEEATKKDEAAKKADPDGFDKDNCAISEFEKMAAKDFKDAFKKVSQQTMTIDNIIKEGLFNGARLDTKAIAAAKAAGEAKK